MFAQAKAFILQYYAEKNLPDPNHRLEEIRAEIENTGAYHHTQSELRYGAQLAWRHSNRCIGRLFYETLEVLDRRHLKTPEAIMKGLREHLHYANNEGKIRPTISIFPPRDPISGSETRILNSKLIRYAGYLMEGSVIGDPQEIKFTKECIRLGWQAPRSMFDLLPVVIQQTGQEPQWFTLTESEALQIKIEHPYYKWFADLGLRWYAVPIVSDMALEIGGIVYTAAPFNGWFMETEIGSRNLGDEKRYNLLPVIAEKMGLSKNPTHSLWKDRALVEINTAVLYSFQKAGVRIVDHHSASKQFMEFCRIETEAGREVTADWQWIVPPMSGSSMEVFHHDWSNKVRSPNFYYNPSPWHQTVLKYPSAGRCPFHLAD